MRLYYAPGTISVAVAITLHEAGVPFEPVMLNFKEAEQTGPEYLALNPKGRVPTLETNGVLLTETGAILDYIAAVTPQAHLVPDDPIEAAQMRSIMYYIASTMHVNHAHKMRGSRWADKPESHADMAAKVPQTMAQSANYLENHCFRGPFFMGPQLTLADPYAFAVCNWLEWDGVALADYPKISGFLDMMRKRASVKAVIDAGMIPA